MHIIKKHRYILYMFIIFIVTFYISSHWFQFQLIQGESMYPTYHSWQLVLLNKNPNSLQRGDVVSFHCKNLNSILVKRIVACPKDTVQIKKGILYINDQPSPLTVSNIKYAGIADCPITLSANEYFVLGDNYEYSIDSRYAQVGCIAEEDILGIVIPQKTNIKQ